MNEIAKIAARDVTDIRTLRRFLDWLHATWVRDPEAGHSINDQIRAHVLEMCAQGHPDAATLAREVLVTDSWDDCTKWFA
jgi:hypothetical protein